MKIFSASNMFAAAVLMASSATAETNLRSGADGVTRDLAAREEFANVISHADRRKRLARISFTHPEGSAGDENPHYPLSYCENIEVVVIDGPSYDVEIIQDTRDVIHAGEIDEAALTFEITGWERSNHCRQALVEYSKMYMDPGLIDETTGQMEQTNIELHISNMGDYHTPALIYKFHNYQPVTPVEWDYSYAQRFTFMPLEEEDEDTAFHRHMDIIIDNLILENENPKYFKSWGAGFLPSITLGRMYGGGPLAEGFADIKSFDVEGFYPSVTLSMHPLSDVFKKVYRSILQDFDNPLTHHTQDYGAAQGSGVDLDQEADAITPFEIHFTNELEASLASDHADLGVAVRTVYQHSMLGCILSRFEHTENFRNIQNSRMELTFTCTSVNSGSQIP